VIAQQYQVLSRRSEADIEFADDGLVIVL